MVSRSPSRTALFSTPSRRFGIRVPHSHPIPPRAPHVCCGKQPTSGDRALGKAQWGSGSCEEPPPLAFPGAHGCRRLLCIAGASRERQQVARHMRAPFLVLTRRWLHRKLVSKQALSLERCWDCWAAGAWCLPRALCLCGFICLVCLGFACFGNAVLTGA